MLFRFFLLVSFSASPFIPLRAAPPHLHCAFLLLLACYRDTCTSCIVFCLLLLSACSPLGKLATGRFLDILPSIRCSPSSIVLFATLLPCTRCWRIMRLWCLPFTIVYPRSCVPIQTESWILFSPQTSHSYLRASGSQPSASSPQAMQKPGLSREE